jgi:NTP pyrophosphatase (non-canonical NTP hydrolase)
VDKIVAKLAESNDYKYNLLKASEELQELALVLTQRALKEERVKDQAIINEIGDVAIRYSVLCELFDNTKIEKRIEHKLKKFEKYLKEGKYKGKI